MDVDHIHTCHNEWYSPQIAYTNKVKMETHTATPNTKQNIYTYAN